MQHFLKIYSVKYKKDDLRLSREVETLLLAYDFPGNVRELENIMQRAVILTEGHTIEVQHLPSSVTGNGVTLVHKARPSTFRAAKQNAMEEFESEYITDCLKATKGNISRASHAAGIDVKNFHVKMKKYNIDPHAFK